MTKQATITIAIEAIETHNLHHGGAPDDSGITVALASTRGGEVFDLRLVHDFVGCVEKLEVGFHVEDVEAALAGVQKAIAVLVHDQAKTGGTMSIFKVPHPSGGFDRIDVAHRDDDDKETERKTFLTWSEALSYRVAFEKTCELIE